MFLNFVIILSVFVFSTLFYKLLNYPLINLCEVEKCPYCFGLDFCSEFEQDSLELSKSSLGDLFTNYLSVKNVYYAHYKNYSVVLKKLAHNVELNRLDALICTENKQDNNCNFTRLHDDQDYMLKVTLSLISRNPNETKNFQVCSRATAAKFLDSLIQGHKLKGIGVFDIDVFLRNVYTTLQLNIEPLIIQVLRAKDDWPVPKYLGACGRVIAETHCGSSLNNFASSPWISRANVALQLLQAAKNFTEKHPDFRFYLTDVSPDNIAVDSNLKISFVDLENVIVAEHTSSDGSDKTVHSTIDDADEENLVYSESDLCTSSLSDHNYHSICKFLLSKNAPWPMMEGGLLHSPPATVAKSHPHLFETVEACVRQTNRLEAVDKIIDFLKEAML